MSFKEETEFNMLTSKGNGYSKHKDHIYKSTSNVDVLKTAAIYGANASGKSNLINAIEYLRDLVIEEPYENLVPTSKRFKLDNNYKNSPTSFRIEYLYQDTHFDYGIEISKGKITEEWLYLIENIKGEKEKLLFKKENNKVVFGEYFNKKDISYLEQFIEKELTDDRTVLNAAYNRIDNNKIIDKIYSAFTKLIIITPYSHNSQYISELLSRSKPKKFAEDILIKAQTGIEGLKIEDMSADKFFSYEDEDFKDTLIEKISLEAESTKTDIESINALFKTDGMVHGFSKKNDDYIVSILKTKHFSSDNLFELTEESDGTNRLFELTPAFDSLINGSDFVFIVDELERSMHPILAKELVRLFSQSKTSSNQLIFTTHESHLLDFEIFRQDEIWFTEKKIDGSTEFYPLSKFKPREDKDIRKGYLQGRYGGIPFLGDFSKLQTLD
jgi:AAA15 family ATPase/GTPase